MTLYVGIDLGKRHHMAALLSTALLAQFGDFTACPTFAVEQSRAGFDRLTAALAQHAPPENTCVLVERTGHYGAALEQYLHERGITIYRMHVREHVSRKKTDKRDAQALAVLLYNQIELRIPMLDKASRVHRLLPPSPTATLLRSLVQHRTELKRETTQRKNQLTAIADELFPELEAVFPNVCAPSALALRKAYPTPETVRNAPLTDLLATRHFRRPGNAAYAHLQELAATSIGTRNPYRVRALVTEQGQLITELALLDAHITALTGEIETLVRQDRAGRILLSFPCIGVNHAAVILAYSGNIQSFESRAAFRSFCGWAPTEFQSGSSFDYSTLKKSGHNLIKQTLYLVAIAAIQQPTKWADLYHRLLPDKATWNARTGKYEGTMTVIGRVCGQMAGLIYTLLKRDADLLASLREGEEPPEPELYTPAKHHIRPSSMRPSKQAGGD